MHSSSKENLYIMSAEKHQGMLFNGYWRKIRDTVCLCKRKTVYPVGNINSLFLCNSQTWTDKNKQQGQY